MFFNERLEIARGENERLVKFNKRLKGILKSRKCGELIELPSNKYSTAA